MYRLLLASKPDAAARAHLLRLADLIGSVRTLEQRLDDLEATRQQHTLLCAALTDATKEAKQGEPRRVGHITYV